VRIWISAVARAPLFTPSYVAQLDAFAFFTFGLLILRYYGPTHGQSVCTTCHTFLYSNKLENDVFDDIDDEGNVELASVEQDRDAENSESDRDSGNDEPSYYVYAARGAAANIVERQQPQEDKNSDTDQGANFVRVELDKEDHHLMCKFLSSFKIHSLCSNFNHF
jgi:hypothetical protein